jgi:hypothetical protein
MTLTDIEGRLAAIAADFQKAETNLNRALAFAGNCEAAYRQASGTMRRQFNLAFSERLLIDDDYTVTSELVEPFDTILSDKLRHAAIAKADEGIRADIEEALRQRDAQIAEVINEQRPQEPELVLVGTDSPTTPHEVVGWSQNNMVGETCRRANHALMAAPTVVLA